METYYFVLVSCAVIATVQNLNSENSSRMLRLLPSNQVSGIEGSQLQVNCTAHVATPPHGIYWYSERKNRYVRSMKRDNHTMSLIFPRLHRSDAGIYICVLNMAGGRVIERRVSIWVMGKKIWNPCSSTMFRCRSDNQCIFMQYRCDNIPHCTDGSDEFDCPGPTPCGDRFQCDNGRCIDLNLVCDKFHNNDCGDLSDEQCQVDAFLEHFRIAFDPLPQASTTNPQQMSVNAHVHWLKTTVYSVIGCTVGVVLFVAVLVIVVFRLKMRSAARRRMLFRLWGSTRLAEARLGLTRSSRVSIARLTQTRSESSPFLPTCQSGLCVHSEQGHNCTRCGHIILNVNNGVQYVPSLNHPPPYTDAPPPPYNTLDRNHGQSVHVGQHEDGSADAPCHTQTCSSSPRTSPPDYTSEADESPSNLATGETNDDMMDVYTQNETCRIDS